VAICNAIETAADSGGPVGLLPLNVATDSLVAPTVSASRITDTRRQSLRLPPVGFGCSRYRDNTCVDRIDSIATALDAGYRLLDSAALYGNGHRIGDLLAAPGLPSRDSLSLVRKVGRTNHQRDHLISACAGSRVELGIDIFGGICCTGLRPGHIVAHWTARPSSTSASGNGSHFRKKTAGASRRLISRLNKRGKNLEAIMERDWARILCL
jgi:hypothetical protein